MTADKEVFTEGTSDFYTTFDDAWSRMFAMILGTRQPHNDIKEKFRGFIEERLRRDKEERLYALQLSPCSEQDIINLFPDFIEYLGDW
jgi:hypothetical protein